MRLYELKENYKEIMELIEEGEIDNCTLIDTLASVQFEMDVKVENIVKLIKNMQADQKAFREEEKRFAEKRRALENRVESIKNYLQYCICELPNKKIKTELFSVYMQKNVPSLDIQEGAKIPEEYYIEQEPKLDKRQLLLEIKEGKKIENVEIKQTESIRIK